MAEYTKKYQFGKVDYNNNGKKANLVEIEINLEFKDKKPVFTATGNVWNVRHTDIVMGGQCIDSIWEEFSGQIEMPSLYKEIMRLWKKWHLNDMKAGCKHQRAAKWEDKLIDSAKPKTQDNMRVWQGVEDGGLLGKACDKCGYKYGTQWLYESIDHKDLTKIYKLVGMDVLDIARLNYR